MCGRIALTPKLEKIIAQFGVAGVTLDELAPSYNIAPSKLVPVVTYAEKIQHRQIELMKWGLVPGWAKDPKIGNKMINSRAETVATKFKRNFAERRCLIPADGFFEWHVQTRDPYFIKLKGEDMLGFAGIWASWKPPEGKNLHTFSIITGPPNELVKPIHNRMPVIIDRNDYQKWLSPSTSPADAETMLKPDSPDEIAFSQLRASILIAGSN